MNAYIEQGPMLCQCLSSWLHKWCPHLAYCMYSEMLL